jgi:uncharacterized protein (TIGR02271 family)
MNGDRHDVVRSEEELRVDDEPQAIGSARVRKHVDTERVAQVVVRGVEQAGLERAPARDADSGEIETLPDGSVSIPVFEEQLVIEKRLVVRERVIVRKHTVVEEECVEADLRRERIEVDVDQTVAARVREG